MTTSLFFFNRNTISNNNSFKNTIRLSRSRSGVSPVIATTIILAITIALGLSLWSFANAGVSKATNDYANAITDYGRYTNDRFVIANLAFDHDGSGPASGAIAIWIFNSGLADTRIESIILDCKECAIPVHKTINKGDLHDTDPSDDFSVPPTTIQPKQLKTLWFASGISFESDKKYDFQVLSDTGAYQTYYQEK